MLIVELLQTMSVKKDVAAKKPSKVFKRTGLAKETVNLPDDFDETFDALDKDVEELFYGDVLWNIYWILIFWFGLCSLTEKLPYEAYAVINAPENEIYYSAVSVWEIGIKHSKSPGKMPIFSRLLAEGCDVAGMLSLPVTKEHAIAVTNLSRAENTPPHNDPFDRMLIAQANMDSKTT